MIIEKMAADLGLQGAFIDAVARGASHAYKIYSIPKRGGGERLIEHPSKQLKALQRWFLQYVIPGLPVHQAAHGHRLLYIGISPSAPPSNGKAPSSQSLQSRVRYHYSGNAEGSTLRLTLGCLLSNELGIELRRVGSGKRMTFSTGEARLSEWMEENARVVWHVCSEPWRLEEELIASADLPLNLDQNRHHGFHSTLTQIRRQAKATARELSVL